MTTPPSRDHSPLTTPLRRVLNFLTGTVGFLLNVVAMLHVRYTSPLTHMIMGSLKGAITTFISVLVLGDVINPQGVAGLALLVVASVLYSYFRRQIALERSSAKQ